MIEEIRIEDLDPEAFIEDRVAEISAAVGGGEAINALSGGVDSAAVTMLGHRAIGDRLKTYFVENGLMRKDEPQSVVSLFASLGVHVELIDAREQFFQALSGVTDPEEKREAVTQTFYKEVFGQLVRDSGATHLLQGTILTDVDETVAGIKRQHNVFEQLGIDPQEAFGYRILEPLVRIRKDGVRKVAAALGLPESTYNRMPFPGPALAARVIGEVTPERIELVRQATAVVEEELADVDAFLKVLRLLFSIEKKGSLTGKRREPQSAVCSRMWAIPVESVGGVRKPTAKRLLVSSFCRWTQRAPVSWWSS